MTTRTETVSIDDERNGIHMNDYQSRQEFIDGLSQWYKDNGWELPNYEDFGDYYDEFQEMNQ